MTLPASSASLDTAPAPACAFRIGEGWDTHALVAGRKLSFVNGMSAKVMDGTVVKATQSIKL